jgi:hypothetical protein
MRLGGNVSGIQREPFAGKATRTTNFFGVNSNARSTQASETNLKTAFTLRDS